MIFKEGNLQFDFTNSSKAEKLDASGIPIPNGMKLVDCVIEEKHCIFLLEIKDPSAGPKKNEPHANEAYKKEKFKFVEKLKNNTLISEDLTPKARDSYTYLHLMERDNLPMKFVFFLGADKLELDEGSIITFKDRLLQRLRKETNTPWSRKYIDDCLVLTEKSWHIAFPQYPFLRKE